MSATPTADAPAPAPKSRKKLLVLLVAGTLLAGAGGAGAWWFTGRPATAGAKPPAKTYFVTLEPFTVNLQDPRGERFAQVGVTLEITDPKTEASIKDRLPAVRNNILLLLAAKPIDDLLTPEGKQQLAQEIRQQAESALGFAPPPSPAASAADAPARPVQGVLFSQFIVQ